MAARKPRVNPFYVLLVLAGVAFCVTAFGFGLLAITDLKAGSAPIDAYGSLTAEPTNPEHPLLKFLDRHGVTLLLVELSILAFASIAAMATDRFWDPPTSPNAPGDRTR